MVTLHSPMIMEMEESSEMLLFNSLLIWLITCEDKAHLLTVKASHLMHPYIYLHLSLKITLKSARLNSVSCSSVVLSYLV